MSNRQIDRQKHIQTDSHFHIQLKLIMHQSSYKTHKSCLDINNIVLALQNVNSREAGNYKTIIIISFCWPTNRKKVSMDDK